MSNLIRYQEPELAPWAPLNRLSSLRDEIDRLFDLSFPGFDRGVTLFSGWSPALDVYQDKDNVYAKLELPGMRKEDIDISLHQGTLSISGERKQEEKHGEGAMFRSERFFGRFQRSVTLPTAVDPAKVRAVYRDGILTVTLPKTEEAKPKQIQVDVS
jgi:HSP20 family protein